jgi:pyruvate/2-oxoglutarate dehydrogenase complex dihydrolipoamide acyltransferase (E2) component
VTPRPVVLGDAIEVRSTVRVRYSYDERIEDGFYCARALSEVKALVEDPASWL